MAFGRRRFTQLVHHVVRGPDGKPASEYRARFVSLDLGDVAEQVDEETLKRELDDNAREVRPLPDGEEKLALAALIAQAKGKTASRARVAAQVERVMSRQTSIIDALQPAERAAVERFRKLLALRVSGSDRAEAALASSRHDFIDTARDVLTFVDFYLPNPKPKGP